ncbi:kinase-like domain-containing protein [Schizophyllum fasciatum]
MHFLRRQGLPIPIPRLVDYWETNEEAYLIMEYIEGQSLLPLWRHLSGEQHAHIIQTLSGYVYALRAIPQAAIPSLAPAGWIGSATGGAFTDLAITWSEAPLGPFPTQAAFNDWRMSLYARYGESSTTIAARLADARRAMRDDHPIVFTHGDINMGNVLVRVHGQGPQDVEIVALLDWEQAGWRPLYWEAMKWIWLSRRHPTMSPWKDFAWKELSAGYDQDVRREFQLWEISSTPPDIED